MIPKTRTSHFSFIRFNMGLAVVLGLMLLGSIPFVHALQIHHIFAEVDRDGHQHSDFDLCQWTQQHAGTSLVWDTPSIFRRSVVAGFLPLKRDSVPHSVISSLVHLRGPPAFFIS